MEIIRNMKLEKNAEKLMNWELVWNVFQFQQFQEITLARIPLDDLIELVSYDQRWQFQK